MTDWAEMVGEEDDCGFCSGDGNERSKEEK